MMLDIKSEQKWPLVVVKKAIKGRFYFYVYIDCAKHPRGVLLFCAKSRGLALPACSFPGRAYVQTEVYRNRGEGGFRGRKSGELMQGISVNSDEIKRKAARKNHAALDRRLARANKSIISQISFFVNRVWKSGDEVLPFE